MKRISLRLVAALVLSALSLVLVWWLFWYVPGETRPNTETLHKLAEAGQMNSRFALGEAYRLGRGEDKDMVQAYEWHKKAALQGHTGSQYMMGQILEQGDGVRQNLARAFEWYSLAAKMSDNPDAEFAMAQMYFHGHGVAQDFAEAFILYEKAARKGQRIAQHMLGAMYEEGWANGRDLVEAYKWYTLALPGRQAAIALNPLYDSRLMLDRLMPRMTKFQIRRGDEAVKDWKIEHDDPFSNN
jgi:TPR repeat protein